METGPSLVRELHRPAGQGPLPATSLTEKRVADPWLGISASL
jgi:hypothetical protein